MKIKIVCDSCDFEKYSTLLKSAGFEIDMNSSLVFMDRNASNKPLFGLLNDEWYPILWKDIIYIESFGREVFLHSINGRYQLNERLYELLDILDEKEYIRINKSQIVSKSHILKIKSSLDSRVIITMSNFDTLYVNRSYKSAFIEFLEI
jgi:two-component system response regulator LytT